MGFRGRTTQIWASFRPKWTRFRDLGPFSAGGLPALGSKVIFPTRDLPDSGSGIVISIGGVIGLDSGISFPPGV